MRLFTRGFHVSASVGAVALALVASGASAQSSTPAASEGGVEDIVVTARKRDETSLSVPVVITAMGQQELGRRNIINVDNFARTVPTLIVADAAGAVQGGTVSLRGISASEANGFSDQAVAFNVDGLQVARASVRRMSEVDLQQIEVLRGPQALYFGKNSPGGIIVIRTADPTQDFRAKLSVGYEAYAHEKRVEGYISTPLTESFGARVAFSGSRMRGYVRNVSPDIAGFTKDHDWGPRMRDYTGRLTLKFDDGGPLTARFKLGYANVKSNGLYATAQRVFCPLGTPQLAPQDNCRADDEMVRSDPGAGFTNLPLLTRRPSMKQDQILSSLELNYDLSDQLTLTSVSGYYKSTFDFSDVLNGIPADTTLLNRLAYAHNGLGIKEISQEVRLASNFDGPLNGMIGGYYQDSKLTFNTFPALNALAPAQLPGTFPGYYTQKGEAYSFFANLNFKVTDTIELAGGARYSKETKDFIPRLLNKTLITTARPSRSWNNWSPEGTITWRPTNQLTIFTAYKRGFLSGGYNMGNGNPASDRSYGQQIVQGYEGGIKGLFFNGTLRTNFAAYNYKIKGQQVTSFENGITAVVNNAGGARSKGLEFDANWKTPLEGLSIYGAIAYNKAYYTKYETAPCYNGMLRLFNGFRTAGQQGICGQLFSGAAFTQDLKGTDLLRAPRWGGNIGMTYETTDGNGNKFTFGANTSYSDDYQTDGNNKPGSRQPSYWLVDGSFSVKTPKGFEVALIGRNLTNEFYYTRTTDQLFSGANPVNPNPGGAPVAVAGIQADSFAGVSRGREILLRLSFELGNKD